MALFSKKSKKIICSGDSYTDNYRIGNEGGKNGFPPFNVWPNFLGQRLSDDEYFIPSRDLINIGSSGAGNYEIYSRTVDTIAKHKNIGLVVVMWSEFSRVDLEVDLRDFVADKKENSDIATHLSYTRLHKGGSRYPVYFENLHPGKIVQENKPGVVRVDQNGKRVDTKNWKYKLSEIYHTKKTSNTYSGINAFVRYVYSIQSICKSENIPLMQIMGTSPLTCEGLYGNYLTEGVAADAAKIVGGGGPWQEACDVLIKHSTIDKIEDSFIGWPVFKELGGFHVDDLLEKNDSKWNGRRGNCWPADLRVSEKDSHPNLKGHKFLGDYLYEQYKDLYSDS